MTLTGDLEIPDISGTAANGSSFFLTLDDSSFNPLLGTGPSGQLVEVDLDALGNPTIINYSPASEASVTAVPEPRLTMLVTALLAILALGRARFYFPLKRGQK